MGHPNDWWKHFDGSDDPAAKATAADLQKLYERVLREGSGPPTIPSREPSPGLARKDQRMLASKIVLTSRGFDVLRYERLAGTLESVCVARERHDDRGVRLDP